MMSLFEGRPNGLNSSFVKGVCNRFAGYLGNAAVLFEQLLRYRKIDLPIRLAPIDHVVQQLAIQCSSANQLQNLLLAVARLMALSSDSSWSLVHSIVAGCEAREHALTDALLQLSAAPSDDADQSSCRPSESAQQVITPRFAFALLTAELFRLSNGSNIDIVRSTYVAGIAEGRDGNASQVIAKLGTTGFYRLEDNGNDAAIIRVAGLILERLESVAKARNPEVMALVAEVVSERLYPLDPGLACSWALLQVQVFCGSSHARDIPKSRSHTEVAWQETHPRALVMAAFHCAPYLVAVLGLPTIIRTVEEEVLRLASEDSGSFWNEQSRGTASRNGESPRPVSGLLAAVAILGKEGEEQVWGMLCRVMAAALGAGAGNMSIGGTVWIDDEGSDSGGLRGQHEYQKLVAGVRQAADVLAAVEGMTLVSSSTANLDNGDCQVVAGVVNVLTDRLETMLRQLLFPESADPPAHRFEVIVRAFQMHVKHASSQVILGVYDRILRTAGGGLLYNAAAAPATTAATSVQQQQQLQRQEQQRLLLLGLVRSRMQHLAQSGGPNLEQGGPGGAAAAGSARGLVAGDFTFAMQCLSDFARQGKDHLSKVAGLYKAKWIQGVKPVLLRPTLDEEVARLRYRYLKEASERFRLISDNELDGWERLHEKMGVAFEGPRDVSVPQEGDGGGEAAVVRSPVYDLLRRLAFVGPSLTGTTLDAVMGALEAALAEELSLHSTVAAAPVTDAPGMQPCGESNGSSGAGARRQESSAGAVEAHIAELVLEAFVAAEELEATAAAHTAGACPGVIQGPPASAAATVSALASAPPVAASTRPALRRRQSHMSWQLRMLDILARWPQLHAPLVSRLLQLSTDPTFCCSLDEVQVMGLAAALAAMSCVIVRRESASIVNPEASMDLWHDAPAADGRCPGGGFSEGVGLGDDTGTGAHRRLWGTSARYSWQLPRKLAVNGDRTSQVQWREPLKAAGAASLPADGIQAVPGPAFAQAVLGAALPLGPSPQHLRFASTFLAAYLRQCGLFGSWVLYGGDESNEDVPDDGGNAARGVLYYSLDAGDRYPTPLCILAGVDARRGPVPIWVSSPVGDSERWRRYQQLFGTDIAGCVPCMALRTLVWIQKHSEMYTNPADLEGVGAGGGGECWSDALRVCETFKATGLGSAMMAGWMEACSSGQGQQTVGGNTLSVAPERGWAVAGDMVAWWDEAAMLRLTLQALRQGLQMPRRLISDQALLRRRHMFPTDTKGRQRQESDGKREFQLRREMEASGQCEEQNVSENGVVEMMVSGRGRSYGGLPHMKRLRGLREGE